MAHVTIGLEREMSLGPSTGWRQGVSRPTLTSLKKKMPEPFKCALHNNLALCEICFQTIFARSFQQYLAGIIEDDSS